MTKKQFRMLTLLNEQIQQCEHCSLYRNGRCNPSFTNESQYVIIGEAPGKNEVENNKPFCGSAGTYLWHIMDRHGLRREQFLIINTVNCRPVNGKKNGKPKASEMKSCSTWIDKYIKVLKPKAILTLGNYAMSNITGDVQGIIDLNGTILKSKKYKANVILSVHPSTCIYYGSEGKKMLYESIKKFKEKLI